VLTISIPDTGDYFTDKYKAAVLTAVRPIGLLNSGGGAHRVETMRVLRTYYGTSDGYYSLVVTVVPAQLCELLCP